MPDLHLVPPTPDCADELLRFETDNRAFFEARINARPPAYYSPDGVRAAIAQAERVLAVEFASVTDNPLIFPETGEVVSGGNFHGQPLAVTIDALKV
ncbi:UNVERIFIED_CONTAM: aromatic amino acid lyase, partial [Prevotella sp. 15_C9]